MSDAIYLKLGSRDKSVSWYDAPIDKVDDQVRDLLEKYSNIPPEQVVPRCIEAVSPFIKSMELRC